MIILPKKCCKSTQNIKNSINELATREVLLLKLEEVNIQSRPVQKQVEIGACKAYVKSSSSGINQNPYYQYEDMQENGGVLQAFLFDGGVFPFSQKPTHIIWEGDTYQINDIIKLAELKLEGGSYSSPIGKPFVRVNCTLFKNQK